MSARGIFVTGTDTDVGKTWVAVRIIRELRKQGIDAVGMKPIECGGHDDSQALLAASQDSNLTLEEVNPVHLPEALAPAAASEPIRIEFEKLKANFDTLADKHDFVVVEGAGGWHVPVDEKKSMVDLAVLLDLPVLIVAANRLGALNHTLLTAAAVDQSGLPTAAIFLNQLADDADLSCQTNAGILKKNLEKIPVIDQDLEELVTLCLEL